MVDLGEKLLENQKNQSFKLSDFSYSNFISENIDAHIISNFNKLSKILCAIVLIVSCLVCFFGNMGVFFDPSKGIFSGFFSNGLFYILISINVLVLSLFHNKKLNFLSTILTCIIGIFIILQFGSLFHLFGLNNISFFYCDHIFFPLVYCGFFLIILSIKFNKYSDLAQLLTIILLVVNFSGFLYFLGLGHFLKMGSIILSFLFNMIISLILLGIKPEGKYLNPLFLSISGSKLAISLLISAPVFLIIYTATLIFLENIITLPVKRGVLITTGIMIFLICLLTYYASKLNKSDYSKIVSEKLMFETENFFEDILETIVEGVMVVNNEGNIIYINDMMCDYFNFSSSVIGKPLDFNGSPFSIIQKDYSQVISKLSPKFIDVIKVQSKTGEKFVSGWIIPRFFNDKYIGSIFIATDVTKKETVTRSLKNEAREKDVLLTEIHHRVKNNMQIIISLLNLQSRNIDADDVKMAIFHIQGRIKAMALIHESLYQKLDFGNIFLPDYIENLVNELTFNYFNNNISINLDVDSVSLNLDNVIPLGLIINEILNNALIHAFPNGEYGKIDLMFYKQDKKCMLVIKDNGVGFPEDTPKRIGSQLVLALVKELEGVMDIKSDEGCRVRIQFDYKE